MRKSLLYVLLFILAVSNVWAWLHIYALRENQRGLLRTIEQMRELRVEQDDKIWVLIRGKRELAFELDGLTRVVAQQQQLIYSVTTWLNGLYGYGDDTQKTKKR